MPSSWQGRLVKGPDLGLTVVHSPGGPTLGPARSQLCLKGRPSPNPFLTCLAGTALVPTSPLKQLAGPPLGPARRPRPFQSHPALFTSRALSPLPPPIFFTLKTTDPWLDSQANLFAEFPINQPKKRSITTRYDESRRAARGGGGC